MSFPSLAIEPEHIDLRENISRVLGDICTPRAVHAFWNGEGDLAALTWATATELGWLCAPLPEAYGGLGLGPSASAVLHQELGRVLAPGPFISTLAGAQWQAEFAGKDICETWLPAVAAGEATIAVPGSLSPGNALALSDGGLSGRMTMLGPASPTLAIVPVQAERSERAFAIIRPDPASVEFLPYDSWDRTRQLTTMVCRGTEPIKVIADPDGRALRGLLRAAALAVASDSVGAASSIAQTTVDYLKTRVQFGRPIGSFQALKHRAADLVASISTAQHLVGHALDEARAGSAEADMWASLAKAGAADAFVFVAGDCVQLHGGIGHTWEYDCHMYLKRARLNEAIVGPHSWLRDLAADLLRTADLELGL